MLITALIADGLRQSHQLPWLGFLVLYWEAVAREQGICMQLLMQGWKKLTKTLFFTPCLLILYGGAHPTVGGTSIPNLDARARKMVPEFGRWYAGDP